MKRITFIFFVALCSFTAVKAVLKEKDLNQTISVLMAELENSFNEQKETMARYRDRVDRQHRNMVAIMERSYQISLMLYSQKEDYTFDLSYACHEATEQYREFKLNRMPFDKITARLDNEIRRYDSLIETLSNLPPAKKSNVHNADSVKAGKKSRQHPFVLNAQSQHCRDVCIDIATKMRDNLKEAKYGIEKDKQYYSRIEKRLKRINDYAEKRYADIQKSIFINGGSSYFEVLGSIGKYFDVARSDAKEKYQSESINTKDGAQIEVKSQWRGPIVLFLAVFILFYLSVASVLGGAIVKWVVPRRFRTEGFMKKKVCIMLVAAVVIFALVLSVVRLFMGHHNFILMASSLLIELAWLIGVILMSLLIRLDGNQIRSGFKIYAPIMLMGFIIITFRIIFIPNNLVNLIFPPILLLVTVWNWFVVMRNNNNIPRSDVFYTWVSIIIMVISTVASWSGYTLMAVQILIWWLFQLTCIQTITCLFYLLGIYELRYLTKKIKGLIYAGAGMDGKAVASGGEIKAKALERLKKNKGDYIDKTWFFDLVYMVIVPVMGVVSVMLSIWWSADVFDLTGSIYKVFFINFLNITGVISLSLQKMVMAMSLWFMFRYIAYLLKALYRKYKKPGKSSGNKPNLTLANNIISIMVWGGYIIICMIMLHIPAGAIETVSAGLAAGLGFAMKDLLENFFYGISLMSGRVRVGDYIECDGIRGKVESITYQSTQIITSDGSVMAFLNSALFNKNFKNLTRNNSYEFVKLPVGVAYGTDIKEVRQILIKAISELHAKGKDGREVISSDKAMSVVIDEFADNSVNLYFTCWVMVEEKFAVVSRIKETIYNVLNEHNIEIPFPQRDIYIKNYNNEQTTEKS